MTLGDVSGWLEIHYMMNRAIYCGLVLAAVLVSGGRAVADVTILTDPAAFAGLSVFDFNGEAPVNSVVSVFDITLPGAFMESNGGDLFHVDPGYTDDGFTLGLPAGAALSNADSTDYVASPGQTANDVETGIAVEFDSLDYPTAIAMDVGKLVAASTNDLTISFSFLPQGAAMPLLPLTLTVSDLTDGYAFRGFTFDQPIEFMEILLEDHSNAGDAVTNALGFDNFYFGNASDVVTVPAPGAAALAMMGFGMVGWLRRTIG